MRYAFMDQTTHSMGTLGAIHLHLASTMHAKPKDGFLLHTCHRLEWYSDDAWGAPIPELAMRPQWRGASSALIRLSQIASGARSVVAGDTFVLRQVVDAGRLVEKPTLKAFVGEAVEMAEQARRKFDLVPVVDYSDVPRALVAGPTPLNGRMAGRLIVVGGGMLAQALASASMDSFRQVIMVTRSTARLRRTVAEMPIPSTAIVVVNAQDAITHHTHEPFNLIIATTSSRPSYRSNVAALAGHGNAVSTLDFSATPLLPRTTPRYSHISDDNVLTWIRAINRPVEIRAAEARAWIRTTVTGRPMRREPGLQMGMRR